MPKKCSLAQKTSNFGLTQKLAQEGLYLLGELFKAKESGIGAVPKQSSSAPVAHIREFPVMLCQVNYSKIVPKF